MANVPTVSHNEATPAGSDNLSAGDDRIREFKTQVREIIAVDHKMDSSGQGSTWGYHDAIHLIETADLGTGAVGATILGSQTVGGEGELVYTDEGDTDVIITKLGVLNVTAAAIAAIGAAVDFGAYKVTALTFESDQATGTAPFTVASTTVVTNLHAANSDALGGYNYNETELKPFGARVSRNNNTVYQAATDGIVEVFLAPTDGSGGYSAGYTDGSNPPTTLVRGGAAFWVQAVSIYARYGGFAMSVKKGDYYRIIATTIQGTLNQTIYWVPMGV